MCTLSLFHYQQQLIITMTRDESRLRHEAGLTPLEIGNTKLLYPIDGQAGGTWFGINDKGVVMALLNRYQDPQVQDAPTRGKIIPTALEKGAYHDILIHLNGADFSGFNPFDLFLITINHCHHFSWNGLQTKTTTECHNAMLFSSSGLNTNFVLAKRQAYFKQQLAQYSAQEWHAQAILERLHLHQDPLDPSTSVLMDRPQTHSKSICQIKLQANNCQFNYYPEASLHQWREQPLTTSLLPYQQHTLTVTAEHNLMKDLA